ncbi:Retrotransposon-derived protein peg10 [Entomophthora muscae]|uniref:Retrotransposon-derived protein peg10 n=1 Tax=Entomophthora muscae TaxID=34485 RepID=A0ACC2TDC6_9FUNG|nr:Retrotransposon-derived protein peg10 [Entomophthora muscae]
MSCPAPKGRLFKNIFTITYLSNSCLHCCRSPQFSRADLQLLLGFVVSFLSQVTSKFLQLLLFLAALPDDQTQLERPFSSKNKELLKTFSFLKSNGTCKTTSLRLVKEGHNPSSYTNQTLMHRPTLLLTDPNSPPTPRRSSILQISSLVTTEIGLALTPYTIQNYSLFVSSLLSFSGEDEESSNPSASCFAGLTQGLLPLGKYNQKFCSLQSRLQASDTKACSFYKLGLNKLLQEFLVHHNLSNKLEPLIKEVIKLIQKYLSSKTPPPSNLSPAAQLFVSDKVPLPSNPPPGTEPKSGRGFRLTSEEVLRRRNNNLCSYCESKDHILPACPLSKHSSYFNKSSTLTLLFFIDTSKSSTLLVTIHGPLGKIKVLALLDTGANANFIEEKLAKLIGLSASGSLDVKVENSTIISATPILQPVIIDLEGSPFRVMCNSSPNLSFPLFLDFHG